jgi:hypothetical protein
VPSTGGQIVAQVGVALSTTELDIQIGPPVLRGSVVGPPGTSGLIGPTGPSGPSGPSGATAQVYQSFTNGDAGTLAPGTPVYIDSSGLMHSANAGAATTASVFGILTASTAASASGVVQFVGALTLTATQWQAVTPSSAGIMAGSWYFLNTTTGQLTVTAPTTTGQLLVVLGLAVSTTILALNIDPPIQL